MFYPSNARFWATPTNVLTSLMILCFIIKFLIVIAECKPPRPLLRGVTFRNWPYADRINDRYEGFIVDLMNMIAQKVGFEYRLYFSPDGKYGTEFNGNINGMIGEVFRNRADFAIADLTVTESRKRYVDFTDAFLENQLAAIIRRDDAVGLRTLEDLVTLNEINHRPDLPPKERRGLLTYGTYRTGATYYHLSKNKDPIAKKIYEWMVRNPDALVTSAKEGFDRVNAGRYAFIVESTFAEYLTGIYCNLTMLYDTRSLYPRKFAIALPKGSPYLDGFNKAIRELRSAGIIQRLRHKYWINRCGTRNDDNGAGDAHPLPSTSRPIQQPHPPSSSSTPSASQAVGSAKADNNGKIDGQDNADNRNDHQPPAPAPPPPPQLSGHHNNHNHNNNLNGKNNVTANAIQFEWASHNHHNNGNPHPVDRNRQPHPNQPPPLSPSLIHHRINYHHRNRMNHNHNEHYPSHPDYSDDNGVLLDDGVGRSDDQTYYSGKGSRKRIQNSAFSIQNGSTVGFVLTIVILATALVDHVGIR